MKAPNADMNTIVCLRSDPEHAPVREPILAQSNEVLLVCGVDDVAAEEVDKRGNSTTELRWREGITNSGSGSANERIHAAFCSRGAGKTWACCATRVCHACDGGHTLGQ
jgi:hypothetical protein